MKRDCSMMVIDATKPGEKGREFVVGTFADGSGTRAYSLWYNPAWPGCVQYRVIAASGREARKAAVKARKEEDGPGRAAR